MQAIVALLLVAVSYAVAEDAAVGHHGDKGYGYGYEPGYHHVGNGVAAVYRNDERQIAVNHVADKIGTGTGTARFYGVPGTGLYNPGYGYGHGNGHGYGHGGYGGDAYGYGNGYGHGFGNGYGHGGYGYGGYGGY